MKLLETTKLKQILVLVLGLMAADLSAQGKTTFGSTNASLCYQESKMPFSDIGLRYCTDAIRNDDLVIRDLAATYTNRGIIYAANGKFEKAMEDHDQAFLLAPEMANILVNRGNVFHQIHNYENALADYNAAIELASVAFDTVYYNKALTLIRLKRWDDARQALETALEFNPDSGRVQRKLSQFDEPTEQPKPAVVSPTD